MIDTCPHAWPAKPHILAKMRTSSPYHHRSFSCFIYSLHILALVFCPLQNIIKDLCGFAFEHRLDGVCKAQQHVLAPVGTHCLHADGKSCSIVAYRDGHAWDARQIGQEHVPHQRRHPRHIALAGCKGIQWDFGRSNRGARRQDHIHRCKDARALFDRMRAGLLSSKQIDSRELAGQRENDLSVPAHVPNSRAPPRLNKGRHLSRDCRGKSFGEDVQKRNTDRMNLRPAMLKLLKSALKGGKNIWTGLFSPIPIHTDCQIAQIIDEIESRCVRNRLVQAVLIAHICTGDDAVCKSKVTSRCGKRPRVPDTPCHFGDRWDAGERRLQPKDAAECCRQADGTATVGPDGERGDSGRNRGC
eukprot:m.91870 g.91870  ORF g.91870 m.91870 type:complete len:358 (-) comp8495_c0_seq12:917-1990(-)